MKSSNTNSTLDTCRHTSNSEKKHGKPAQPMTLKLHPIHQYGGTNPYFRKPAEVGHFSLDGKRCYHNDASQLRYYAPPADKQFSLNLREGYESYIEKDDDVKERLTHLLTWIIKHREVFTLKDQKPEDVVRLNTDFIAWRGHITKFLITPYQTREPWKMAATLFNGTIFISEVETEKARLDRLNRTPLHEEMCYWGYKFEDYMTQPTQDSEEAEAEASHVNSNEAYCSIVRARLAKHSILMGAEVDCCIQCHPLKPPENYVELKTSREMNSFKQKENFMKYKLMKFWAQSFLSGLPLIVVGLRDDDGIVTSLKEYKTLSIPRLSEDGHVVKWDANLCMNFLNSLLKWLKKVVLLDNPDVVYMVSFDEPSDDVSIEVIDDGSERFLPSWFTDEFSEQRSSVS